MNSLREQCEPYRLATIRIDLRLINPIWNLTYGNNRPVQKKHIHDLWSHTICAQIKPPSSSRWHCSESVDDKQTTEPGSYQKSELRKSRKRDHCRWLRHQGFYRILDEFWAKSHSTKAYSVGGLLRGRLDFILSHQLLARGEARRFAELPDLQLLNLDNEGQ